MIFSTLFTACLQGVFRALGWEQLEIRVNREYLNKLGLADDIALLRNSGYECQGMVTGLDR